MSLSISDDGSKTLDENAWIYGHTYGQGSSIVVADEVSIYDDDDISMLHDSAG